MAETFDPQTLWRPFGAFSQMVLQGPGQIVHLKGQVALDATGTIVGPHDMARQLVQVLDNIGTALASVGGRMGDVTSLVHYTTDIAAFMACGEIRASYFSAPYPVTTTLEVHALYDPRLVVEITASAEVPQDRFVRPEDARPMHGPAEA